MKDIYNNIDSQNLSSTEKAKRKTSSLFNSLPKDLRELLVQHWNVKQNPAYHPEGNTLKHIIVVVQRAFLKHPDDINMPLAALFHDLGKLRTYDINPKTGQPTAYGHEKASTEIVDKYKDWISSFKGADVEKIKYIVKNHMLMKPGTWDVMKSSKKEPIEKDSNFKDLKNFATLDKGGNELSETLKIIIDNILQQYLI